MGGETGGRGIDGFVCCHCNLHLLYLPSFGFALELVFDRNDTESNATAAEEFLPI